MAEELKGQQAGGSGADPTEGAGSETTPATETATTPPEGTTGISPEMQKAIDQAIADVRAEYEGKGGHLAKLRSSYDKQISQLKRQVGQRQHAEYQAAMELLESGDYEQAAPILAAQVQALTGQTQRDSQRAEMSDWIQRVMGDLGFDLDEDEEAATVAAEWLDKLIDTPDLTWDFQQEVARKQIELQQEQAKAAQKELAKIKEDLPSLVKAQVAQMLTEAGFAPEPSGEGAGTRQTEDLTELSEAELWERGTAERRAARKKK